MFRLTSGEERMLKALRVPSVAQDFLDELPFNHEEKGETCMSPRRVLKERRANCIEGAMLIAAAFMLDGRKPLILNLKVDNKRDDDHVVVLFCENGYWGAVSKTNHAVLRYRDPVYASIRELAMSYFHEYFLVKDGSKTMIGYSKPINLRKFGTKWITEEKDLWHIAEAVYDSAYESSVPVQNKKLPRNATNLERKAAGIPLTHR
jgi:hypothetical protein